MHLTTCPLVITVGVDEVVEEDEVEVIHHTMRLKKAEYNVNFVVARTTLFKIAGTSLIKRSNHPPLLYCDRVCRSVRSTSKQIKPYKREHRFT